MARSTPAPFTPAARRLVRGGLRPQAGLCARRRREQDARSLDRFYATKAERREQLLADLEAGVEVNVVLLELLQKELELEAWAEAHAEEEVA